MASVRVVRKRLADGSIKEYRYEHHQPRAGRNSPGTIGALLEAYKRSPEWQSKRPNTKASYGLYFNELDGLATQPVAALRRRFVLSIRDELASERGPATATRFVRTVSALLTWAVEREWIEHNPLTRIKALPGGHLRAWAAEEYDMVLPHLTEPLRRAVILARYTGQRRGDLIAMRWPQYDGRAIRLVQQKTGDEADGPMVIPAAAELRGELDAWRAGAIAPHPDRSILTTERGVSWCPTYLSRLIGEAVVGIDPGLRGLNIHGLRKLAATALAEAGCSTHEIAAITGHATLSMVQLYTRSVRQEQLADTAISRLETARGNRSKLSI
jgi:integrase